MGMEEGCLSFSVPNICLYKQCAAPPPSGPGLWAWGGSALFIWRGRFPCSPGVSRCGMAAALNAGSPWAGGQCLQLLCGQCLVGRGKGGRSAQWSGRPRLCFASCVAFDRLLNLSEPVFSSIVGMLTDLWRGMSRTSQSQTQSAALSPEGSCLLCSRGFFP